MKQPFILLSSLVIASMLLAACGAGTTVAPTTIAVSAINPTPVLTEKNLAVVASVNGDKITADDFQIQAKVQRVQAISRYMQYMQYAQMYGVKDPLNDPSFGPVLKTETDRLNDPNVLGQEVINLLINERLIRQEAKKRGIVISKEELDKALKQGFGFYPNGTPTPAPASTAMVLPTLNPTEAAIIGSPTPTAVTIAAPTATADTTSPVLPIATPMTLDGFNSLYKERVTSLQKETGLDENGYLRLVETGLISDKLLAQISKDMKTTQEQVWARHILVKTLEEATAVQTRLRNGENFATVAAQVSIDTSNKNKGGDLGWFGKGMMVLPFEEASFTLAVGQISDPVKSAFGYHIIQIIGHEERPMNDKEILQAKQTILADFLKGLRGTSDVQIFDIWKTIVPTEPALPPGQ